MPFPYSCVKTQKKFVIIVRKTYTCACIIILYLRTQLALKYHNVERKQLHTDIQKHELKVVSCYIVFICCIFIQFAILFHFSSLISPLLSLPPSPLTPFPLLPSPSPLLSLPSSPLTPFPLLPSPSPPSLHSPSPLSFSPPFPSFLPPHSIPSPPLSFSPPFPSPFPSLSPHSPPSSLLSPSLAGVVQWPSSWLLYFTTEDSFRSTPTTYSLAWTRKVCPCHYSSPILL